ncbi:MAG: indolepyruvate ferredoxin oxidoreductase family protein [Chromatiales bacterium]|jgi:indolepyruvate ferredoxin oxidoreductase|nr:indolepyruvate ferredoxin oxidoreductase family protein [Chromatiales bacterium]
MVVGAPSLITRIGRRQVLKTSAVSLDDKYTQDSGRAYMSGLQALVRLPIMQRQRDLAAGLNTAGYISGYRGSPLGGYDSALTRAQPFLEAHHIKFHPGLNEDLAATAVWGSQHTEVFPGGKYDGVFSIWYGKGPGVDRSGDVLKHGNFAGAGKNGGVLLLAGDDHGAKSSSMPHQSEQAFVAALIPVLNPASVQEYLDFGLWAFGASRFSGCWVGFKAISDTVESSASVSVDPHRLQLVTPTDFAMPEGGLGIDVAYQPVPYEVRLHDQKLPALLAYARANPVDRVVIDAPDAKLGVVTTGKGYLDLRQALDDLGITEEKAAEVGLRVYKVGLTWPIEPQGMKAFADGLDEIMVVEEKRGFIEEQLTKLFYNVEGAPRSIVGKTDEQGQALIPATGELNPGIVARALTRRLRRYTDRPEFDQALSRLDQIGARMAKVTPGLTRSPYFCSGCPHNTSTRLPEGSRAMAGIGCHAMAMFHPERRTAYATHMGAEGVNWIGHSPFTEEKHLFANLGDGTYDHSGLLAIRAAVAANVNITYKILYNDAVAMTGGQPLGGSVTPLSIVRQVMAEGVERTVVVTDEPDKYPADFFPKGVKTFERDALDRVQKGLRDVPGVTVLVYDQTCAAEKRRRRKRGLMVDPPKRAFINDLVCEGCGDCSEQSNCVSVQPLETPFGRKRRIDQSNCNKDFSCVKGFCPSFVTVHGGAVRRAKAAGLGTTDADVFAGLSEPVLPSSAEPYGIMITGIGGTGVITIGALLGMAAHLDGRGVTVLDQTGLAQKNGAVGSHVRIADDLDDLHATRISAGGARLLLGCDIVTASTPDVLGMLEQGMSSAVVNGHVTPPAAFVIDNTIDLSSKVMAKQITEATSEGQADFVDATNLATTLLGDSIASNLFMVGYAFQKGLIPLRRESLEEAIRLNGVAVDFNLQAFNWGRLTVQRPADVEKMVGAALRDGDESEERQTLDEIIAERTAFLTDYQDAAYAEAYSSAVMKVRSEEASRTPGKDALTEAVARNLFKLMAYKDEYEVARLYTRPEFLEKLEKQFEGDYSLHFHLAPPLLSRRDPNTGNPRKREYGPWILTAMSFLASMRHLRGGTFDIFGYSDERRMERQLVEDYRAMVDTLVQRLNHDDYHRIVEIAQIPDQIRGFGHIKTRNVEIAKKREAKLFDALENKPESVVIEAPRLRA